MSELRGRDLRVHRIRAGLTQKQLADRMNLHPTVLSAAETEAIAEVISEDFASKYIAACAAAPVAAGAA